MEAILLNSGGPDTLASIIVLKEKYDNLLLHSVLIDCGQYNIVRSKYAASEIAKEYCESHEEVFLPGEWKTYNEYDQDYRYVYQALLFNTIGAIKARQKKLKYYIGGYDTGITEGFQNKFTLLLRDNPSAPCIVIPIFPIRHLSKEERLNIIKNNKFCNITASCRDEIPCGICDRCKIRISCGLEPN